MPVCDPSQNPPLPAGLAPWSGAIPQGVSQWIWPLANDTSIPIGSLYFKTFNGQPIAARVECHTFTVLPDGTQQPGRFHGVTLYRVTDPSVMRTPGTVGASKGGSTDWKAVGVSFAAAGAVVGAFFWALRAADRRPRRARA